MENNEKMEVGGGGMQPWTYVEHKAKSMECK